MWVGPVSAQTPPVGAAVAESVSGFYSWYLDYSATGPGAGRTGSVLADRAYRESPFLTRRLVQSVDALIANADPNEGWGDDPFLLGRGIPARISVEVVTTARHAATALVGMYSGDNPLPRLLAVRLTDEGGLWKLDDIRPDDVTPAGAVQSFYDTYLRSGRHLDEPDVDGTACTGASYLTTEPAQWAIHRGHIDPFTLSAEAPARVEASTLGTANHQAQVLLERWFPGQAASSPVVVWLQDTGECWQIARVHTSVEPQMTAQVFYDRYLQAVRYSRAYDLPLANTIDSIPFAHYMDLRRIEETRLLLARPVAFEVDPILNAAELPVSVRAELVEKTPVWATVTITGFYPDGAGGERRERLVVLDLRLQDQRWLIAKIYPQ